MQYNIILVFDQKQPFLHQDLNDQITFKYCLLEIIGNIYFDNMFFIFTKKKKD